MSHILLIAIKKPVPHRENRLLFSELLWRNTVSSATRLSFLKNYGFIERTRSFVSPGSPEFTLSETYFLMSSKNDI
jgi:hypothetical protein